MAEKTKQVKRPKSGYVRFSTTDTTFDINPNDFFDKVDDILDAIDEIENTDPKTFGLIQTRILALLSLPREITGEGEIADFVRQVFSNIKDFNSILFEMLYSIPVGYSITEMVWEELDGKFVIQNLIPRRQTLFTFSKNNELLRRTEKNEDGEKTSENKFVTMTFQRKYGKKFGTSLMQKIYWYWFLKKNSSKFWAIYLEKFAAPIVIAEEPNNISPEDRAKLDSFINNVRMATGIKVPEGTVIKFLEAQQHGIDTFEKFLEYVDSSIAIAILGQTLTSDNGSGTGSYALGSVHEKVRQDILQADINMLESTINDYIIKPLVDYNFSDVKSYPKWKIVKKDTVNLKDMSDVVKTLSEAGMKTIPVNYLHELFGIPVPEENEDCLVMTKTEPSPGETKSFAEKPEVQLYMEELKKIGYEVSYG